MRGTMWKVLICLAMILSSLAVGLSVAVWLATDVSVIQSGEVVEGSLTVDMNHVLLHYHDQLRGIGPNTLTVRQVIQDALWYQVNHLHSSEQTRMECFSMIGLFHEGRVTEVTGEQYTILVDAMRVVWGPGVLAEFERLVGGEQ